jgi:hypothetical protein
MKRIVLLILVFLSPVLVAISDSELLERYDCDLRTIVKNANLVTTIQLAELETEAKKIAATAYGPPLVRSVTSGYKIPLLHVMCGLRDLGFPGTREWLEKFIMNLGALSRDLQVHFLIPYIASSRASRKCAIEDLSEILKLLVPDRTIGADQLHAVARAFATRFPEATPTTHMLSFSRCGFPHAAPGWKHKTL